MELKLGLSRDPRVETVTVPEQTRGKSKVAEIMAKVGDTDALKRVGQARFSGNGADSRYERVGLELENSLACLKDDLCMALGIKAETVTLVGVVHEPVAPAATGAQGDQEM